MPLFQFHVRVSDRGKPKLTSEMFAEVLISISDVNDCPPQFSQTEYNTTLLLPTYANVVVLQVRSTFCWFILQTSSLKMCLKILQINFRSMPLIRIQDLLPCWPMNLRIISKEHFPLAANLGY